MAAEFELAIIGGGLAAVRARSRRTGRPAAEGSCSSRPTRPSPKVAR
jgi:hypothetical protein